MLQNKNENHCPCSCKEEVKNIKKKIVNITTSDDRWTSDGAERQIKTNHNPAPEWLKKGIKIIK